MQDYSIVIEILKLTHKKDELNYDPTTISLLNQKLVLHKNDNWKLMEFSIIDHGENYQNDCHDKFGCYKKKFLKLQKVNDEDGNGTTAPNYIHIYFNLLQ